MSIHLTGVQMVKALHTVMVNRRKQMIMCTAMFHWLILKAERSNQLLQQVPVNQIHCLAPMEN